MGKIIYKFLMFAGFIMLFHTAYSAAQHRTFMRNMDQEFTSLPFDITFQGVCSLFIIMFSILQTGGDFKEIRASVDLGTKSWETYRNIPSFYTFNHRGKALSQNYMGDGEDLELE